MDRTEAVAREDLVTFLGAATTETGQDGFYAAAGGVELDFLHEYVLVNYRELYAATLAASINDRNAGLVVANLLTQPGDPIARRSEGALIAARLRRMPPQRVWKLFEGLCRAGRGNRRLRAIAQEWLDGRDPAFDAVKYRRAMRVVVRHLHLRVPADVADVLTGRWRRAGWSAGGGAGGGVGAGGPAGAHPSGSVLLETWRRAHFEDRAVFDLPFTVAEGLAARRGIRRAELLRRAHLTSHERLRLTTSAGRLGVAVAGDLAAVPLRRLTTYVLSLDLAERERRRAELTQALRAAARRAVARTDAAGSWGRVAAVLDDSYSSSGSTPARRAPLIAAVGAAFVLEVMAAQFRSAWTSGRRDALLATPHGSTDLAGPILDALDWAPDLLVIVSDGVDTDPPGAAGEVLRVWSERIDDGSTAVLHLNPVFDPDRYGVRTLTPAVPTLGLRDPADLPLLRSLAGVAQGRMTRAELAEWLLGHAT